MRHELTPVSEILEQVAIITQPLGREIVERQHGEEPALAVVGKRSGLAVDPRELEPGTHPSALLEEPHEERGDALPAVDRLARGVRLPTAVPDGHRVGGQKLEQPVHVFRRRTLRRNAARARRAPRIDVQPESVQATSTCHLGASPPHLRDREAISEG
jgi:hypothetical protein